MATRPWIFLINTFYSNTVDTIKKALSLTNDHLAKLTANEADAYILAIKTIYLPLHNAFITAYNQLDAKLGIYHGKSLTFREMLDELANEKINEWRGVVFAVFPEQTVDAETIFQHDREPFQKGTYDERVEAVRTLSEILATYTTKPTLVTLSTETLAYYTILTGARALQQTDEGSVNTLRTNLKTMHRILCIGMYRNLGGLMAKYAETPETVADYFDLTLLRDTGEDDPIVINGTIAATSILNIDAQLDAAGVDGTPSTILRMRNTSSGSSPLIFYFSNSPSSAPGAGPQFTVPAGEELEKTVAEMGGITLSFFNIQNPTLVEGSWEIEIEP